MDKKAQVTIFVIIAILIIAAVSLFFLLKSSIGEKSKYPAEIEPIYNHISTCLKDSSIKGLNFIATQGGYYKAPEALSKDCFDKKLVFYYLNSREYIPTTKKIEHEMNDYLLNYLGDCFDLNYYRKQGYNITEKNFSISTKVNAENLNIKMDYPLVISKRETKVSLKNFNSEITFNTKKFLDSSKELVEDYSKNPEFICLSCIANTENKYNLNIEAGSLDLSGENITLFSISDKEQKLNQELKWKFIVE